MSNKIRAVLFVLSIVSGIVVATCEFTSPHPAQPKQTKPWLDR